MLSRTTNIAKNYCNKTCALSIIRRIKMDKGCMIKSVKECIPPLDGSRYKGQAGRIGVVGGSLEYTGAPYFAGISALKLSSPWGVSPSPLVMDRGYMPRNCSMLIQVGADLVHIFCTAPAAAVIKSYSPDLIVHPLLDHTNAISEISPWLDRLHAIVIGPGLGREAETFKVVTELIKTIQAKKIPLVIDADGLFLITENHELIKDFSSPVILTPNKIEFERLYKKVGVLGVTQLGPQVTILRKGAMDEIFSPCNNALWKLNVGGSGRRCGGQGDLLSGSIAAFLHWTLSNADKTEVEKADKELVAASMACYAASLLIRLCNERAFEVKGRSMLATDMIEHIHECFEELFGK